MSDALFQYPPQAAVKRVMPKSKIYAKAAPSRAVRAAFVEQIDELVWLYKLAAETVNLPERPSVLEIQVFGIRLRVPELSESILRTIDRAIASPIVFELSYEGRVKSVAAYKRPSDADSAKWVVDSYYATAWMPKSAQRVPLPVVLDLAGLYERLLYRHIGITERTGESLSEYVERANAIRTTETACRKLEQRLQAEPQFNRRVDVNRELRSLRLELDALKT